jgi:hypothetical protein
VKTCHICSTEFPSGLTCPGCGAFVVDVPVDEPPPESSASAPAPSPLEAPAPGSLGGWVTRAPSTGPAAEADAEPEPEPEPERARPPGAEPPAPGSLGGWVTPDRAPTTSGVRTTTGWVYKPPPLPGSPEAAPPPPSPPPSPSPSPSPSPPPPPGASEAPRPALAPAPVPRAPSVEGPGAGGPGAPPIPVPPKTGGIDPKLVVGVVVVVALVLGFLLLRPKDSAPAATGSLTTLAGTCIRYSADRSQLDKSVPCTDPHDGVVLAYVTEQSTCPPETDGILSTQSDTAGTNGVLCIDEAP